jgi:hypothetical protein
VRHADSLAICGLAAGAGIPIEIAERIIVPPRLWNTGSALKSVLLENLTPGDFVAQREAF